jgi:hypothetical protein
MHIKIGSTRAVFIFNSFVLKFPIVRLHLALRQFWHLLRDGGLREHWQRWTSRNMGTLPFILFSSTIINWQEYCFWHTTKMPILAPTYFSFFGLFNIQQRVKPVEQEEYYGRLDSAEIKSADCRGTALHEFMSEENFGWLEDRLVMVDYGSHRVIPVLLKYRRAFERFFVK